MARDKVTLSVDTKSVPLAHTDPDGKTTFTITLPGPAASAVTVPVIITQDQDWLSTSRLNQDVTIAANQSTATLELTNRWFWQDNSAALPSGNLTATLGAVAGYNASGQRQTIYVHGRSQETGITVLDQTDYRFNEASGDNTIHVVSTLEPMVTPTKLADHSVLISTKAEPTRNGPAQARAGTTRKFPACRSPSRQDDYQLERGRYVARKSFTLTVYDDAFPRNPSTSDWNCAAGKITLTRRFPYASGPPARPRPRTRPQRVGGHRLRRRGRPREPCRHRGQRQPDQPQLGRTQHPRQHRHHRIPRRGRGERGQHELGRTHRQHRLNIDHTLPHRPAPGATRHYRVAAIDDAGAGMTSRTASATTSGTPSGPIFTNAYLAVSRQSVTLNFSKNLLETDASLPSTTDFTVKVDGTAVTVSSVAVSGSQVLLASGKRRR